MRVTKEESLGIEEGEFKTDSFLKLLWLLLLLLLLPCLVREHLRLLSDALSYV